MTTSTITTTITVPPDFFDVHYWYFGIFVMFCVVGIIDSIYMDRTGSSLNSDSFILINFLGLFIGSIISLFLNVIPFTVPLVIFGLFIVYIWRFRG